MDPSSGDKLFPLDESPRTKFIVIEYLHAITIFSCYWTEIRQRSSCNQGNQELDVKHWLTKNYHCIVSWFKTALNINLYFPILWKTFYYSLVTTVQKKWNKQNFVMFIRSYKCLGDRKGNVDLEKNCSHEMIMFLIATFQCRSHEGVLLASGFVNNKIRHYVSQNKFNLSSASR